MILCWNCHKYAPDHKEEFEEYMKEECDGTMTIFLKAWKQFRKENPKLFEDNIFSKIEIKQK